MSRRTAIRRRARSSTNIAFANGEYGRQGPGGQWVFGVASLRRTRRQRRRQAAKPNGNNPRVSIDAVRLMHFDLVDLSLFRHVVEAGSITAAAERAHLALAAASTRIRNMEQALGAALLVRSRQGVTPTQAGRTLLQHARAILRQAERLREDLGAYAGGLAGQIRVLSNTNAQEFLPEALSSFLSAHPQVSVDLEERLSDEIVGLIAEGVGDLGIVAATVDVRPLETSQLTNERL